MLGGRGLILNKINICILRAGGTNCDIETKRALDDFDGVSSEIIRINRLGDSEKLHEYDCLIIPGGFSYGDHIRAGVVFANTILTNLGDDLKNFAEEGGLILGICNGFQVLIETGLLPELEGISEFPKAALAINESAKYECRWTHLKNDNGGNCVFTEEIEEGEELFMPVAHKEGRFILQKEKEEEILEKLRKNDQIVFRYCDEDGNYAKGKYPQNPNGAIQDIAGICDPKGKIFGLMPHPERAYQGLHLPDWTRRKKVPKYADGRRVFKSMIEHLK